MSYKKRTRVSTQNGSSPVESSHLSANSRQKTTKSSTSSKMDKIKNPKKGAVSTSRKTGRGRSTEKLSKEQRGSTRSSSLHQKRAKAFVLTRQRRSIEAAEDYTKLIADLIDSCGEARICNLADHLGVSHVTALRTVRRLQNEGYLLTERQKPVVLTGKGKKLAREAKNKHLLLTQFLSKLGVPEQVAKNDAEGIEHYISPQTITAIKRYVKAPHQVIDAGP